MAFIITNFHKSEKEIYKEAIKRCPISDLHIRDEAFKLDDGITVIAKHFCRVIELEELILTGALVTLLCACGLIFYWWSYKHHNLNKTDKNALFMFSIILVILNVGFWIFQINSYNTTHIEYTVIIDDTVGFNDFYEKYEILSVNGNEFTVIEK